MRIYKFYWLLFCTALLCSCSQKPLKNSHISPADSLIQYEGRISISDSVASLYWPGSSVRIAFEGKDLSVKLSDQRGANHYTVLVDNKPGFVIKTAIGEKEYQLLSDSQVAKHEVLLFKRNDFSTGTTKFYGFESKAPIKLLPVPSKRRTIEFYGNSITVGSDMYRDSLAPYGDENNFMSYAALTARHFDAEYTCIARPGIGLMVSWFPMIMPDVYDLENPWDSTSKWDFSKNVPDLVVINLMQNDCALFDLPDHAEFKKRFGSEKPPEEFILNAYRNFVGTIRSKYPSAQIICALGSMDAVKPGSPWPGYIEKAVASMNDPKIFTHFFHFINTPHHPNEKEHGEMAESLIKFIDGHIKW